MEIVRHTLSGVPVIILYEQTLEAAREKGCILCYHGLTSSKDEWIHDLTKLAERGFVVVGVDNYGHGERRDPEFDTTYEQAKPDFWTNFVGSVRTTAAEVPGLIDDLAQRGFAQEDRVGALGVSMGGFIVYSAILLEPRLHVAVTLVSSPEWWGLENPDSPHRRLEGFARVKLLSITAGRDETVPNRYTHAFYTRLRAYFDDYDERFAHRVYPQSDHHLDPDWDEAWDAAAKWLETHL